MIQADVRAGAPVRRPLRRDPPPLAPALVPTDDRLMVRLAEEIDFARRSMDLLGDRLSGDSAVVMRHMVALQSLDVVGQMLGHIAAVIRSSDRPGAVERIGMAELRARLKRTSID